MLLSITVPAYQVEAYLPRCLESLISQSLEDLEVIVVNDGSTDNTGQICDDYASRDPRFKIVHQNNKGLVAARKAAAEVARGQYIACVDGDDYLDRHFCGDLMNIALDTSADMVVGRHIRDYRDIRQEIAPAVAPGIYGGEDLGKILARYISDRPFFSHGIPTYLWGKVFRRELYMEAQSLVPDHLTIGEDAACVYPMLPRCRKLAVTRVAGYHYVQRQSSMLKTGEDNVGRELSKISSLFSFLRPALDGVVEGAGIPRQLREYEFSQLVIRSGGVLSLPDGRPAVFGAALDSGAKVVVLSAGTFGQMMYRRLRAFDGVEVVAWLDHDWVQYRHDGLPVSPESSLFGNLFDFVLVASLNEEFISEATARLAGMGIGAHRILSACPPADFDHVIGEIYALGAGYDGS
jgi:glycosyltransferase involved in cell wall biosynthesis